MKIEDVDLIVKYTIDLQQPFIWYRALTFENNFDILEIEQEIFILQTSEPIERKSLEFLLANSHIRESEGKPHDSFRIGSSSDYGKEILSGVKNKRIREILEQDLLGETQDYRTNTRIRVLNVKAAITSWHNYLNSLTPQEAEKRKGSIIHNTVMRHQPGYPQYQSDPDTVWMWIDKFDQLLANEWAKCVILKTDFFWFIIKTNSTMRPELHGLYIEKYGNEELLKEIMKDEEVVILDITVSMWNRLLELKPRRLIVRNGRTCVITTGHKDKYDIIADEIAKTMPQIDIMTLVTDIFPIKQ